MGFCFFANIAVAIEAAKARHGVERVAVLDWDVHHGNGTQAIYYRRDDVLSISLHQDGCFPPGYSGAEDIGEDRGRGFNLNVPLLPGGGHDAYMQAMQRIVLPALERFRPQLIVVASGFDANAVDPLARMQLHSDSFRAMTAMVRDAAERHAGGRLVVVHEGGYSEAYVPFCGLAVIEELSGVRSAVRDRCATSSSCSSPTRRSATSSASASKSWPHSSACARRSRFKRPGSARPAPGRCTAPAR